jgi:sodium/potassium-transporting ATPase subunit alpha
MVSFCYGQIAVIEATGGFFAYIVSFTECGFWPSRLIGVRTYWDSQSIHDFPDSYGQEWTYEQRKRLERASQTCFFIGIVLSQLSNILINKTKRESLFSHGFKNSHMNAAIVATLGLAAFLVYVPNLNKGLGLYAIQGSWWLPALPFALFLFVYAELRKFFCRKFPKSWYDEEFTW